MSKSVLPPRPHLGHLQLQAKQCLRAVQEGDSGQTQRLRTLPKYAQASDAEIRAAATLLETQQVLAQVYGFDSWAALKAHVLAATPTLGYARPVLKIGSYEEAIEHYVGWLGFRLDWDWREAPGRPTIAALSRDHCAFMINEDPSTLGPVALHLDVANLDALLQEWNTRRPGAAEARVAPPYEFRDVWISDPWGNVIVFEDKSEAELQQQLDVQRPRARRYVEDALSAGKEMPTPEEVRHMVDVPLGVAIEVLNEFPAYGLAYVARRRAAHAEDGQAGDR